MNFQTKVGILENIGTLEEKKEKYEREE